MNWMKKATINPRRIAMWAYSFNISKFSSQSWQTDVFFLGNALKCWTKDFHPLFFALNDAHKLSDIFSFYFFSENLRLNEYISHYETLDYDTKHIHASHTRAKRSVTKDHHVYLKFKAHGRDFHIRLNRDLQTFSDNLVVSNILFKSKIYHIYLT